MYNLWQILYFLVIGTHHYLNYSDAAALQLQPKHFLPIQVEEVESSCSL